MTVTSPYELESVAMMFQHLIIQDKIDLCNGVYKKALFWDVLANLRGKNNNKKRTTTKNQQGSGQPCNYWRWIDPPQLFNFVEITLEGQQPGLPALAQFHA